MRLVCPNCGAQYEVDDRVIPDNGRDVQCSSCGHGWYQMPLHLEEAEGEPLDAVEVAEAEEEPAPVADAGTAPQPDEDLRPDTAPAATPEPEPDEANEADGEAEDGAEAPVAAAVPPATPKRPLDDDLRAILQEEAERELEARASERMREPAAMEIQGELGLDEMPGEPAGRPAAPEDAVEDHLEDEDETEGEDWDDEAVFSSEPGAEEEDTRADMGGAALAAAAAAAGAGTTAIAATAEAGKKAGRELFPDIDEINSTLDSHGGLDSAPDMEVEGEEKSGFGRGFFAVIFIAALALALYLVAPQLSQTVPALEPVLTGYVGAVDAARAWLDGLVQGITGGIEGAAGTDAG